MRLLLPILLLLPLLATAEDANPVEARLRDALRQLTARVQTAETEAATLRADHTALQSKAETLQAALDKLTKESTAARSESEKAAAAAQSRLADREAELAATKAALEKWKAAHAQVTELGRKAEAARAALAVKAATLENRVADLTRKNLGLWKIGDEVLTRLEKFSYGTAIAAREPFVGATRVRLENEIQGYKDKLLDPKLKP